MRRLLTLVLVSFLAFSVFAQEGVIKKNLTPINKKDLSYAKKVMDKAVVKFDASKDFNTIDVIGDPIGSTNYDLQTNSAVAHRFLGFGNGKYSAVWIDYDGTNLPTAPERGTGYAHFDGTTWQFVDITGNNDHIEGGAARTGWPTIMTNGTNELVANHYRSDGGLYLWNQPIGSAGTGWTSGSIGGYAEAQLWPRAASTLGSDGNYHLYVISVDDYNTSQTEIQSLWLAKSDDGGQTWTVTQMPQFNDKYVFANGDIYAIDAMDSIVAVAYFADYGDLTVWKSTDYGETWEMLIVNDFPIDAFDMDAQMLDMDNNGVADTLETTDGTGDILIDNEGKVHVVFSVMRNLDETQGDNYAYSYFPYTDGLYYWNEDMPQGQYTGLDHDNYVNVINPNAELIAYSFDLNGDGFIWDFADASDGFPFGTYYTAITSFANMAIDDTGNIYIAFTTVMEGDQYAKSDANPNAQSYRHAWVVVRKADGTWTEPYCISTADGDNAENVFPTVPRRIADKLPVWVQWDNEPGLNIRGDGDPATDNYIVAKFIPTAMFFGGTGGGDTTLVANNINIKVFPNPTDGIVYIENAKNSNVSIYNTLGQEIFRANISFERQIIDLSAFPAGTYIINVENESGTTSYKVLKK